VGNIERLSARSQADRPSARIVYARRSPNEEVGVDCGAQQGEAMTSSILDVTDWEVTAPETRGKRAKSWVAELMPDGTQPRIWLRKEGLSSRPFEHAIEARALRLAGVCGIEAARGQACTWNVSGASKLGIVVRRFLDDEKENFSQGFDELKRHDASYDAERYALHTPERVRGALQRVESEERESLLVVPFARLLLFDAWIGNGDRHPGNRGLIRSAGAAARLAPMYDPAACLGAELGEEAVRALIQDAGRLDRYVERCPSGFGNGDELIRQPGVIAGIRAWPEVQRNAGTWLARFRAAMDTLSDPLYDGLTPERVELAARLLRRRLEWLEARL